jgi:hypothetical protein
MKNTAPLLIIVIVISVAIFLFFKTLFHEELPAYAKEVLAAFLGAVITIFITAILLRSQAINEIQRDKSVGVFHAKLNVYTEFCEFLNEIIRDETFDDDEQQELQLWAMKLTLLSSREVSDCIDDFFTQAHRYRVLLYQTLTDEQKTDFASWSADRYPSRTGAEPSGRFITIGVLLSHLKHDLGEMELSRREDVASAQHAMDDILRANVERLSRRSLANPASRTRAADPVGTE